MRFVEIENRKFLVLNHIKEIKATMNGSLFNRWYNRSQFFKAILGQGDLECLDFEGGLGLLTDEDSWCIEIYDFEKLLTETADGILEGLLDELDYDEFTYQYAYEFLIEDSAGKIYYVKTDID